MLNDKYVTVIDEGVVYANQDLVFGYCGWPSIAKAENGELLAVYSGNRVMHVCPFGKVILQRSRDEGKTWSARTIAVDTPLDDRDAGVLSLPGGKLLVSTFNNTREDQKRYADSSRFGGSALVDLARAYLPTISDTMEEKYYGSLLTLSDDNGFSFGEPFKIPITAPHGPALCSDGSVIYAGTAFPGRPVTEDGQIQVYKSHDYRNFEHIADIKRNPDALDKLYCEPHMIELPSGRLVLHIRVQGEYSGVGERYFTVMQSVSDDGGKTFTVPRLIGAEGSPPHLLQHSSGALVMVYGRRKPPYGIQAMISRNNAETWDGNYFVWDRGVDGDLGYPASVELSNGDIFTIYYAKILNQKPTSILWTRWRLP